MASIWDLFSGNTTPEQNAGLLGFATKFNGALGDGSRPVNFGQALAAGAAGAQQGRNDLADREIQRQQIAQQAKLLGLKVQDAEGDLENQQAARRRAEELRNFYINDAQGAPGGAAAASGDIQAPSQAGMAAQHGMPQGTAAAPAGGGNANLGIYAQRIGQAQRLRAKGYSQEADAAEAAALKFQPKVKGWEKVQQGGKVLFAPFFEDGTSGAPVPLEVAEKLEKVNSGGRTDLVNAYTGGTVRSINNTASPDSILSANTAMRGQNMADARSRDANSLKYDELGIKRGEKIKEENLGKAGQIAAFDTMIGTLGRIKEHPGLSSSTGISSVLPTLPGSDSANFQAELETFKAQAFIPAVAQLKGMGALSDAEGKKLSAAVGALDPRMGEKAFRSSVTRIENDINRARARVVGSARPEVQQQMGGGDTSPKAPVMASKPTANASNKGRTLVDNETGKRFRSNGLQWIEVK